MSQGEPLSAKVDESPEPRFVASDIFRYFLATLPLVGMSDISNRLGPAYYLAQGLLGILLVSSFFLPSRRGLILLLLLAIAGQDIVGSEDNGYATAAIWQINVGPLRPSWIIFLCVGIHLFKMGRLTATPLIRTAMLWFATVPFITGFFYGGFLGKRPEAGQEVVVDLKFGIMLLASLVLFLSALRKDEGLLKWLVPAFVGALLARHFVDLFYYFFNIGPALIEGVSRVSEDTTKGGIVFLVFFGIMLVLVRKKYLLGLGVGMFSLLLLAVYSTRLLWITCAQGALLLPFFVGLRRTVSLAVILALLVTGGLMAFFVISPRSAEAVLARSISITAGREIHKFAVDVPYNVVSRIDPIRYGEGMNIIHASRERFSYLWGTGYGGFYEDAVVNFPHTLMSSYTAYSLNSGIFYLAHLYSLQVFLKHGIIGLILISALWWWPGIGLFRALRRRLLAEGSKMSLLDGFMLCFLAFLPTAIAQFYWSGKGLFINGALLALCMELIRRSGASAEASERRAA